MQREMAPELGGKMTTVAAAAKPAARAYVTFLAGDGDGDYWKGVVGLAKGLRKVCSAYPLVVAVLPDVPESHRRILISQGCIVREIEPVYPPENQTQLAMADYVVNYSKLRIWEFVEYERMVHLDADIQVFDNIDELFELDKGHLYAVMDCFCDKIGYTPQHKTGYDCHQEFFPDEQVSCPAAELVVGPPPPLYFNAGMFVHEPSMATAKALLDTLRVTPPTPLAEKELLNMFFREQYKPIPVVYNLTLAMLRRHPEKVRQLEKVKVAHYSSAGYTTGKGEAVMVDDRTTEDIEKMLVKKRWDICNDDETLDFIKGLPADADKVVVGKKKEKMMPPFSNWLAEAKDAVFARKNLPAMATLAASTAAAGVVATAASPAICFSFYAVLIAALAVVTISLGSI